MALRRSDLLIKRPEAMRNARSRPGSRCIARYFLDGALTLSLHHSLRFCRVRVMATTSFTMYCVTKLCSSILFYFKIIESKFSAACALWWKKMCKSLSETWNVNRKKNDLERQSENERLLAGSGFCREMGFSTAIFGVCFETSIGLDLRRPCLRTAPLRTTAHCCALLAATTSSGRSCTQMYSFIPTLTKRCGPSFPFPWTL